MTEDPRLGSMIGGCRLESVLGRGGMGVVYLAEQNALGRKVALKLITAELAENVAFRERFQRESRMAASIDHPNIVTVHEAGEDGQKIDLSTNTGTDGYAILGGGTDFPPALAAARRIAETLEPR